MHIIKYRWLAEGSLQPFLISAGQEKIRLVGEAINFSVGEKHCIGYFAGGKYSPCPSRALIDSGWNCSACRISDDFFMCMRCDGSECINKKQRLGCEQDVYYIYLAAFDSIIKVGISREQRLVERLVEQGADFGAKVARVKDGKDVRSIEQKIKRELGIVDLVRGELKQRMIFCDPNRCISKLFHAMSALRANGFAQYLVPAEIYDLRSYYGLQNVYYNPQPVKVQAGMQLSGDVAAVKGPIIVLKEGSRLYSVNAHDLIGSDVEADKSMNTEVSASNAV